MNELTFKSCHMFSVQVSAVDSLEGPLLQVEGLSDLRLELHSKKMNMHLVLIDELHRHLYIKSTNRVGQRNKEKGRIRLVLVWFWCVGSGGDRSWREADSVLPLEAETFLGESHRVTPQPFIFGKQMSRVHGCGEEKNSRCVDAPSSL